MAEMNPGSCTVVAMLSGTVSTRGHRMLDWRHPSRSGVLTYQTSLFTLYHCYMFDGLRCLIPSRRHWHRCMLVYMLVLSSLGMFIWATAWGSEFNVAPVDSSLEIDPAE